MKKFWHRLTFAWRLLHADGLVVSVYFRRTSIQYHYINCSAPELQNATRYGNDMLNNLLGGESAVAQANALTNPTP